MLETADIGSFDEFIYSTDRYCYLLKSYMGIVCVTLLDVENERKQCYTIFTDLCKKSKAKACLYKSDAFRNECFRYLIVKIGKCVFKFIIVNSVVGRSAVLKLLARCLAEMDRN